MASFFSFLNTAMFPKECTRATSSIIKGQRPRLTHHTHRGVRAGPYLCGPGRVRVGGRGDGRRRGLLGLLQRAVVHALVRAAAAVARLLALLLLPLLVLLLLALAEPAELLRLLLLPAVLQLPPALFVPLLPLADAVRLAVAVWRRGGGEAPGTVSTGDGLGSAGNGR